MICEPDLKSIECFRATSFHKYYLSPFPTVHHFGSCSSPFPTVHHFGHCSSPFPTMHQSGHCSSPFPTILHLGHVLPQSRLLLRVGRPLDTAERGIRFIALMAQLLGQRLAAHPQLPGFKEVRACMAFQVTNSMAHVCVRRLLNMTLFMFNFIQHASRPGGDAPGWAGWNVLTAWNLSVC